MTSYRVTDECCENGRIRAGWTLVVISWLLALPAFAGSAGPGAGAEAAGFPMVVQPADAQRYRERQPPAADRHPVLTVSIEAQEDPVPDDLTIDLLLEQRDRGRAWQWLDGRTLTDGGATVLVVGPTPEYARCVLVAASKQRAVYALSEPFACPAGDARRALALHPRRTLHGRLLDAVLDEGDTPAWLDISAGGDGFWPYCERGSSGDWSCVGVPAYAASVVILRSSEPVMVSYFPAAGETGTRHSSSIWGVPVCFDVSGLATAAAAGTLADTPVLPGAVTVDVLYPRGRHRARSFSVDATAQVLDLGQGCFWLAGSRAAVEQTVRVRGDGLATLHLPLATLLTTTPSISRTIFLQSPARLAGVVSSSEPDVLGGTLVELYMSPSTAADGDTQIPGHHLEEAQVADDGRFAFDGLAPGTYLVRACHPSLGCAEGTFSTGGAPLRLRLRAEHRVVGRVTFSGAALAHVPVRVLPTLSAYQEAADPTGLFMSPGSRTDEDGRFAIALPATGSFRLAIESGRHGSAFRILGPMETLPQRIDLGEIALTLPVRVTIDFPACPGGLVTLIGPQGDPADILSLHKVVLDGSARGQIELPGSGIYMALADCGNRSFDDTLHPNSIDVPPDITDLSVSFEVRAD
ncbi:MAG: hypothetical protein O7D35_02945 [Acidobacteria bacterium]|nr:hypothetical protein [Acidobacteriota bacterium]